MEEREMFVKTKIINGKKRMGVMDTHLNIIIPFEYAEIKKVHHRLELFICTKDDGRCSFYNGDKCVFSYRRGYKDLECIDDHSWNIKFIAKKDGQVGIIKGNDNQSKFIVDYDFGKADEIINNSQDVKLIKHGPYGDLIGYYSHPHFPGKIIEPEYVEFKPGVINCQSAIFHDVQYTRDNNCYPSGKVKVELTLDTIKYAKYDQEGKLVYGLKYTNNCKDILSPIYSKIEYDADKQIFLLEQNINGEIKKGLKAVAFDWKFNPNGYPLRYYDLLEVIDVPCEYDNIMFIGANYVCLEKDGKYGLVRLSYSRSQGDERHAHDFVSKNHAYGDKDEIAQIIYDSIEPAEKVLHKARFYNGYFIGKIGDEARLITPCNDKLYSHEYNPVTIANDYKNITKMMDHIYVCELANGRKELLVINEAGDEYAHVRQYVEEFRETFDDVEKFDDRFIKATNYGIKPFTDLYYLDPSAKHLGSHNYGCSLNLVDKDVVNISIQKDNVKNDYHCNDKYYVTNANGHIKIISHLGHTILDTKELGIEPKNLNVSYDEKMALYKIVNDNIIRFYSNYNKNHPLQDREFISFDTVKRGNGYLAGYIEPIKDGFASRLTYISFLSNIDAYNETVLLCGNYKIENIVYKGERIIYSGIDPKTGKKKYGVIESSFGKQCIPFEYDYIEYTTDIPYSDRLNQLEGAFICKSEDESVVYDQDGFYYDKLNAEYDYNKSPITILTLNNNPQKNQS